MGHFFLLAGALLGAVYIILSVFVSQMFKMKLKFVELQFLEMGLKMHISHAIVLLIVGIVDLLYPSPVLELSGVLFSTGILVYSGTCYLLAIQGLKSSLNLQKLPGWFKMFVTLGSLSLIGGWVLLCLAAGRLN